MGGKTARLTAIIGLVLLFTGFTYAQPAQSHPLSQIFPVDTDLNMEGYEIRNMSQITLDEGTQSEGLVLDDLTITHEGRAQRLVLDYQNNEWSVENADIALNNNNISEFFDSACEPGQVMADVRNDGTFGCVDATGEVQDDFVSRYGDSMNGTLDMADFDLIGLNRMETSGNGITVTDSGNNLNLMRIQENGDIDLFSGNMEGVRNLRFVDSGNNDRYTMVYDENNNRLALSNAGEDVLRIDDSTNNLILPGGGLDMRNSNIANFFGSACASGDLMVQVNSDGTFDCVDATGEVQEDFVSRSGDSMNGNLDMKGNNILSPGEVDGVNVTNPGNAIRINGNQYSIPTDAIQSDELDQTDSYNLGWGNLAVQQSDITVNDLGPADANLDMNGYNIDNPGSINSYFGSACPSGEVVADVGDDGTFGCVNIDSEIQDTYVNRNGDSMTGNLDMGDNQISNLDLQNVNSIEMDGNIVGGGMDMSIQEVGSILGPANGDTDLNIQTQGSGSQVVSIEDGSSSNVDIARFEEGTQNVVIPNGNLDMNGNSVTNFFGSQCNSGNVAVHVNDDGSIDCVDATSEVQNDFVNRNGDTMTGALDMQGNDIQSPGLVDGINVGSQGNALTEDGSNRIAVASNSISVIELDEGKVDDRYVQLSGDVMSGSLDMNGNSLMNFFGSACPSGEVVADVNSDGTYDCVNIDTEIQNTYVNRNGDSMTGNLDMQGNNVNDVGTINNGGSAVSTGGDINSGGTVQASADLRTGSGTVTSSSEMCIGNQC